MRPLFDKYAPLWRLVRSNRRSLLLSVLWVVLAILSRSWLGLESWWTFLPIVLWPLVLQYITGVCLYRYVVRKTAFVDDITNDELVLVCLIRNSVIAHIHWITFVLISTMLWMLFFEHVPFYALLFLLLAAGLAYLFFVKPLRVKDPKGI